MMIAQAFDTPRKLKKQVIANKVIHCSFNTLSELIIYAFKHVSALTIETLFTRTNKNHFKP